MWRSCISLSAIEARRLADILASGCAGLRYRIVGIASKRCSRDPGIDGKRAAGGGIPETNPCLFAISEIGILTTSKEGMRCDELW